MAISWTLNDGVLTISGSGEWYGYYGSDTPPWNENRDSITSAIIQNGITNIGNRAFYKCTALTSVTIPSSVTEIDGSVFDTCTALTNITIPDSVTSIDVSAFYNCSNLTSITIPNSVTNIGSGAFHNCRALTSITIPDSVTSIGQYVFNNCRALTSIIIPDSVTSIGQYAFDGCRVLADIYYTGSKTDWNSITIDTNNDPLINATIHYNYVFIISNGYCGGEGDGTNLSWTLDNNGVFTISGTGVMKDYSADNLPWYENGNAITSVVIENGVTTIGSSAFYSCTTLESVTIPDSVTSIGNYAFCDCPKLTSMMIPNNVTNIGGGAFWYCTTLTSITIPNSVTNIGDAAFEGSIALTDVYYTGSETDWNMITIGIQNEPLLNATKHYGSSSTNITYLVTKAELTSMANAIRAKVGTTSKYAWPNQMISAIEEIPQLDTTDATATAADILDGKTAYINGEKITGTASGGGSATEPYCEYTFDANGNVTAAKLYGFTSIPTGMFRSYMYLENVDISESPGITKIGDYAFYGCTKLILDSLPSELTSIGQSAFYNCLAVTFTSLPSGLTSIGQSAFYGCKNIELTSLPIGITDIPKQAFDGCTKCAFSYLPSTIKSFGDYAFRKCLGITEIEIAANLKDAFEPSSIFGNNTNLKKVWLRNTCTTIQATNASKAPFAGCSTSLAIYAEPSEKLSGWGTYYNRTGSSGSTEVAVTFNQTTRPW